MVKTIGNIQIGEADLERIFRLKYGDPRRCGWFVKRQARIGYFAPDDFYVALVDNLVTQDSAWIDVGTGRELFPRNEPLARELANRCALLVGLDPTDDLDENEFVHQRAKTTVEDFRSEQRFDLATLNMVAEHLQDPHLAVASLARIIKPGGKVVIYTVNKWSPTSLVSRVTLFPFHKLARRLLWGSKPESAFKTFYRMNSRKRLSRVFAQNGFRECYFAHLADCRIFFRFRLLSFIELCVWRLCRAVRLRYPENNLLGVYEKTTQE